MDSHHSDITLAGSPGNNASDAPRPQRWRRAVVSGSLVLSMLAAGSILLPSVLLQTSAGQWLLGVAAGSGFSVTSSGASGGWLTPLVFQNVQLRDSAGQLDCSIAELSASKGLWAFLFDASTVTTLRLRDPVLRIGIGSDGKWPNFGSGDASISTISFSVENGSFQLSVPWRSLPLVDLDRLSLTGTVGLNLQQRPAIQLNASQIFDHTPLSDAHAEQNLALVAPVLSQTSHMTGSASVWLEPVEIPMDATGSGTPFPIRGRVLFHELEATLSTTLAEQVPALLTQAAGISFPDRLAVTQETQVNFEITESGIHHDRMEFLLPQIAPDFRIASSGTLRLDETLDLQLEVCLPTQLSQNQPWLRLLSYAVKTPLTVGVTGTITEPLPCLPSDFLIPGSTETGLDDNTPHALPSAIGGLIDRVRATGDPRSAAPLAGSILNLIGTQKTPSNDETSANTSSRKTP